MAAMTNVKYSALMAVVNVSPAGGLIAAGRVSAVLLSEVGLKVMPEVMSLAAVGAGAGSEVFKETTGLLLEVLLAGAGPEV